MRNNIEALEAFIKDFKEGIVSIINQGYIVNNVNIQVFYSLWIMIYRRNGDAEEEHAMRSLQMRMMKYSDKIIQMSKKMIVDDIVLFDDFEYNKFITAFLNKKGVIDVEKYIKDIFKIVDDAKKYAEGFELCWEKDFDEDYSAYEGLVNGYLAEVTGVAEEERKRFAGMDLTIKIRD